MNIVTKHVPVVQLIILIALLLPTALIGASHRVAYGQVGSPTVENRSEFPLSIDNCGFQLTLDRAPERVIVMDAAAITMLATVGALDRVVARVGLYPTQYFSDEVNERLASIPELVTDLSSTGGVSISLETVLDLEPDLVIGYETESITRDDLARFGIDLYVIPPFCDEPPAVSFENVYAEVRLYGKMFDRIDTADIAATTLEAEVESILTTPAARGERAAALYVSSDGSAIYVYSRLGMVHVQMEALGLDNLYADLPERVSEVSIETLIDGDPEVLILLYSDTEKTPDEIASLVTQLPGADAISAIKTGRIYPLLFNFSEPPSPLSVQGLSMLAGLLAE